MSIFKKFVETAVGALANAGKNQGEKKQTHSGSAEGVGTYSPDQDQIKALMNSNSQAWHTASDAEKSRLHAQNEYLSGLLGGDIGYDPSSGKWSGMASAPQMEYKGSDAYRDGVQSFTNNTYDKWVQSDQYKALAGRYGQYGNQAMQDTVGQVSARTGGLASSYAVTAGNQQYNNYMTKLEDVARQMYSAERGDQYQNLQLLQGVEDREYQKHRDQLGQYNADRSFYYGAGRDQVGDARYDQEYGDSRGDVNYERLEQQAKNLAAYGDFSGYKALGYTDAQIMQMQKAYQQKASPQKTTGRSGGGSYSGGGSSGQQSTRQDPDGLFSAAWASENPANFIASNYKKYGYTSLTGLQDGFKNWRDDPVENGQSMNKVPFDTLVGNTRRAMDKGRSPDYMYDALRKQGFSDAMIDQVFTALGL